MKMMRFDECNGNDFNGFHRKSFFYCINKRIMDIFGGLFGLILSIIPIIFLAVRIKKRRWTGFLCPRTNWEKW